MLTSYLRCDEQQTEYHFIYGFFFSLSRLWIANMTIGSFNGNEFGYQASEVVIFPQLTIKTILELQIHFTNALTNFNDTPIGSLKWHLCRYYFSCIFSHVHKITLFILVEWLISTQFFFLHLSFSLQPCPSFFFLSITIYSKIHSFWLFTSENSTKYLKFFKSNRL